MLVRVLRKTVPPPRLAAGLAAAAAALTLITGAPALAQEAPDPAVEALILRVGAPPGDVPARLEHGADGVVLRWRGGSARLSDRPIPAAPGSAVGGLGVVVLAGGRAVTTVRVWSDGDPGVAALVGGEARAPRVLWTGDLALRGEDVGERTADVLQVRTLRVDGAAEPAQQVLVGRRREGVRVCGADAPAILEPRAVHPVDGTLRPVVLRRLRDGAAPRALSPATEGPAADGPAIRALRFTASSRADTADPPAALADGDPATWFAGAGAQAFVVGRFQAADARVGALGITPVPTDRRASTLGRPVDVALVDGAGDTFRFTLPADARPGQTFWVRAPDGASFDGSCLTLVAESVAAPPGRSAARGVALAEVTAWSAAELAHGLPGLAARLGGPEGDAYAGLLALAGDRGARAVLDALPGLAGAGRTRAWGVLHRAGLEAARDALLGAASSEAAEGQAHADRAALLALAEGPPADAALLAALTGGGADARDPIGERAAALLARAAPARAIPAVVARMARDGGSGRPALREALDRAARGVGDPSAALTEAVGDVAGEAPPLALVAGAALAVAATPGAEGFVAAALARAPEAERFEDAWRLVAAAADGPPAPAVDAWLGRTVGNADAWMLRAEALTALAARDPAGAADVARVALEDPYPRVRARAAALVPVARAADAERLGHLARADLWPIARAAAVEALAGAPDAGDVIREAVGDPNQGVRAAAVEALARRGDRTAWPLVRGRLLDGDEWPAVLSAGIAYAAEVCVPEAVPALRRLVSRSGRPDAWDPDVGVAVAAVAALGHLPGDAALETLREADSDLAPPAIRAAARRALAERDPCAPE